MRVIGLIVLGVLIGALASIAALNALRPATAFPKGVMALLGHHHGGLRDASTATPCDSAAAARHLEALEVIARDIEPAFLSPEQPDEIFARYAEQLRGAVHAARSEPAADCRALGEQVGRIGDSCKACHRDYKS